VVAGGVGGFELLLNALELTELLVADLPGRPAGQLPADVGLHVGDVGDIATGDRQHYESTTGLLGQQPFGAQPEQRFAHRRDADTELGGELFEPDVTPGPVGAVEDPLTDQPLDILGELRPGSELRGAHLRSGTRRVVAC
jgi:hypothetical protein